MNRALRFTLLGLTVVVVLFAVTRLSIPARGSAHVPFPASLFLPGLGVEVLSCAKYYTHLVDGTHLQTDCTQTKVTGRRLPRQDVSELKSRIAIFYGSIATVIVLVGLAFGAGRRRPPATT